MEFIIFFKLLYKFWMKSPHFVKEGYEDARFHQISTDEVYGSIKEGSFDENSNTFQIPLTQRAKASADML